MKDRRSYSSTETWRGLDACLETEVFDFQASPGVFVLAVVASVWIDFQGHRFGGDGRVGLDATATEEAITQALADARAEALRDLEHGLRYRAQLRTPKGSAARVALTVADLPFTSGTTEGGAS